MPVFGVYNVKGGVGKTASAVNLAFLSAEAGHATLLWDLDPQGATSYYLRGEQPGQKGGGKKLIRGKTDVDTLIQRTSYLQLDILPADFSLRKLDLVLKDEKKPKRRLDKLLTQLRDPYEHIYLDCPPNISLVSENVFMAADVLLVPAVPSILSLRAFEQIEQLLHGKSGAGLQVVPFFCRVDRRKRLHREVCDSRRDGHYAFANTVIPNASEVEKMGLHCAPVFEFAARSPAATAYRQLWRELMARTVTA